MSELFLEILSEEIPARMQARAAEDLKKLVIEGLKAEGLIATGNAMAFATPRRLALVVAGVPAKSPVVSEERKGPRVGAPDAAIQGFLKGAGLKSLGESPLVEDAKKGNFYVARIERPGRAASEIVAEVVPAVMAKFPWPKSQRWGGGSFTWVRPIQSIVCLLAGRVVPFEAGGIRSGNVTRGHRFHGNAPFAVSSFEDYGRKLRDARVLLPASERAEMIREQAQAIARKAKLEWIEDEALLAENAGLTEWPVVLMGTFDEAFLAVPGECLTTSMKNHQKCFSLKDPKTGRLTNRFLLVSNLTAEDGGRNIVAGNERVIRARLSDARFFWDQDLKRPLDEMRTQLRAITFHEKLGSQWDRVERVAELAAEIAGAVDAAPEDARRAAQLCKADLVSGMVGEFPELQGLMGRYYAEAVGTKPEIARAIELHYKPKGPADTVPKESDGDAVACAVALADKLDTLVGFWSVGEKPTGSGDPYQLRRAALGVIRIVLENDFRLPLGLRLARLFTQAFAQIERLATKRKLVAIEKLVAAGVPEESIPEMLFVATEEEIGRPTGDADIREFRIRVRDASFDLLSFFADRLKVHLREKGARHDLIDAVFALGGQDDLALIVKRVEALDAFLKTDDGKTLLAGVKRASNILAIEEKKDKTSYDGDYDLKLLEATEETALAAAIESVKQDTKAALNVESFKGAMNALAELRAPVDAFFDRVTVNAADPKLRENRLRMLSQIRAATLNVADFSRIAG